MVPSGIIQFPDYFEVILIVLLIVYILINGIVVYVVNVRLSLTLTFPQVICTTFFLIVIELGVLTSWINA